MDARDPLGIPALSLAGETASRIDPGKPTVPFGGPRGEGIPGLSAAFPWARFPRVDRSGRISSARSLSHAIEGRRRWIRNSRSPSSGDRSKHSAYPKSSAFVRAPCPSFLSSFVRAPLLPVLLPPRSTPPRSSSLLRRWRQWSGNQGYLLHLFHAIHFPFPAPKELVVL